MVQIDKVPRQFANIGQNCCPQRWLRRRHHHLLFYEQQQQFTVKISNFHSSVIKIKASESLLLRNRLFSRLKPQNFQLVELPKEVPKFQAPFVGFTRTA